MIMKLINDRLKHLILLLLPVLFWLFTSATINTHTHILYNGIKISHAHPYDKSKRDPNQLPAHNHTKGQLILLDLISHPLTLITIAFIGFFLSTKIQIVRFYYLPQCYIREHYYAFNYHAPPPASL